MGRPLLLVVLLLAFALRIYQLDTQSLWWDEGISLHLATSTIPEIFADRLDNIHPPLYFVLLKGWLNLVGVGAFNGRYLSALASLLQIPILYTASRRWFKGANGLTLTAVLLLTVSPIAIIYGQETRVYALLPALYLSLLAVAHRLRCQSTPRLWIAFGALQWFVIHLHYVAAFALIFVNLWLIFPYIVRRFKPDRSSETCQVWMRQWLITNLIAGTLSLPWFTAVLRNFTAVRTHAELGTYTTEATPIPFLISQVWGFHLTGLAAVFSNSMARYGLIAAACLLAILLFIALWQTKTRKTAVFLLAAWLLPVAAAFALWSIRSFAHPRYVIMYAILLPPLAAYATTKTPLSSQALLRATFHVSRFTLLSLLTLLSLWGITRYFFDGTIAKDNVRGVSTYLEAVARPDDLIIIPDTDWSLPFEYDGQTPVIMPDLANREQMWANLAQQTRAGQHVYLFDYERGTYDFQALLPYLLEENGSLEQEQSFGNVFVRSYQLDEAIAPPALVGQNGRFTPLTLQSSAIASASTASAVTVALQWHVTEPLTRRYHVALRLQEAGGWPRGTADQLLLDKNGRPTEQWQVGDQPVTYHVLPIQPGTPPLGYDLTLNVYEVVEAQVQPLDLLDAQGAPQGQQLSLGTVPLTAATSNVNPYGLDYPVAAWSEPRPLSSGLVLAGANPGVATAAPGQSLQIQLRWQALEKVEAAVPPQIGLVQDGTVLVSETAVPADYPPEQWQANETIITTQRLPIPATASGSAQIVVQQGDEQIELGTVQIEASNHLFASPQPTYPLNITFGNAARLIGYDLPTQSFSGSEAVPLTLYWESLTTGIATDYTVFAHILADDGRLVGQHDAPPVNGRRPTTGWVANEFIVDPHEMVFREAYSGLATIEVGLYDPLTNGRLTTSAGQDFVYLPVELTIVE